MLLAIPALATIGIEATTPYLIPRTAAAAAEAQESTAVFLPDGKVKLPPGFRKWVFVGAPLTPNGLNGGKAGFPEYHNVYVEPGSYDIYNRTNKFPEGTILFKELQLTLP